MLRTSRVQTTSAFAQIQGQARQLLSNLRSEIRSKEVDLRRLKDEESKLSALISERVITGRAMPAPGAGAARRIDWSTVLGQLPKQFQANDVRKVRGVQNRRPSEIFAAITRWIEAGTVKRKDRGLYERVEPRSPKKAA